MRSAKVCCLLLLVSALANCAYADLIKGTSSSSVGQGVVIDTPPAPETQPAPEPTSSLGRRAGPTDPTQRSIADPTLLPDCVPANGVVCSDRDYTKLLKVAPAVIDLSPDTNYAFAGFNPKLEVSGVDNTKVGLLDGSFSTDLQGKVNGQVKTTAGDEVVTAGTDTTTTALGTKLSRRPDLLLPSKLALTLGKTEADNKLEWRTNKPNFYYVIGQNLGFPVGFQTVKDGVSGK